MSYQDDPILNEIRRNVSKTIRLTDRKLNLKFYTLQKFQKLNIDIDIDIACRMPSTYTKSFTDIFKYAGVQVIMTSAVLYLVLWPS